MEKRTDRTGNQTLNLRDVEEPETQMPSDGEAGAELHSPLS